MTLREINHITLECKTQNTFHNLMIKSGFRQLYPTKLNGKPVSPLSLIKFSLESKPNFSRVRLSLKLSFSLASRSLSGL